MFTSRYKFQVDSAPLQGVQRLDSRLTSVDKVVTKPHTDQHRQNLRLERGESAFRLRLAAPNNLNPRNEANDSRRCESGPVSTERVRVSRFGECLSSCSHHRDTDDARH